MKELTIIDKSTDLFFSTGEIRYIGQALEHKIDSNNGYEYTKIWVGSLKVENINAKISDNGLVFIKFDVDESSSLKDLEVKHNKAIVEKTEAILYEGVLTILTKLK